MAPLFPLLARNPIKNENVTAANIGHPSANALPSAAKIAAPTS